MAGLLGGGEALLLVGEVVVEGVAGDGGGLDDVGDRHLFVAALGDDPRDRFDQAPELVRAHLLGGQRVAPAGQPARAFLGGLGTGFRHRWQALRFLTRTA